MFTANNQQAPDAGNSHVSASGREPLFVEPQEDHSPSWQRQCNLLTDPELEANQAQSPDPQKLKDNKYCCPKLLNGGVVGYTPW